MRPRRRGIPKKATPKALMPKDCGPSADSEIGHRLSFDPKTIELFLSVLLA
jgi:hypothetical protein